MSSYGPLDLVIVATGLLHAADGFGPEKSLRQLNAERLSRSYLVNAIGPMLVSSAFLPLLNRDRKSVFAALSARVGSISDNRIGGWYGYRAAKAALNQMLRTASIEHARRWPNSAVIGLHPGTVDSSLSQPFQRNVTPEKLFTAENSTADMLKVVDNCTADDSGKIFAYDGSEVPA
ncbi:MAG: SDR family NAD(P)-dependent oxidoreductase [Rhizobiaceae bacterium]|nr:SDR family NAD(P)-dependent oxidoreductase [Rhizobiaceae bacterium]